MSQPLEELGVILEPSAVQLAPPVARQHPPGTVVALAGEAGRYTRFAISMQAISFHVPPGTAIKWMLGSDISESRNQAVSELEGEWVWFIDDDHTFPDDIVMKLLDRDVDIVQPICLRRSQPFKAVPAGLDGDFLRLDDHGPFDLVEVEHAGTSGMLVRRRVFEHLEQPWFELGRDDQGRRISEDVNFCRLARAAGFKVHVDMGVRIGHLTVGALYPVWSEEHNRWLTGVTVADGAQLAIDPA